MDSFSTPIGMDSSIRFLDGQQMELKEKLGWTVVVVWLGGAV